MVMPMLAYLLNIISLLYLELANQIQETIIHEIHYYHSLFPIGSIPQIWFFICHSFHFIFSPFSLIHRHKFTKLNKLSLSKDDISIEYLPAVEAWLAFPYCGCTPPTVPYKFINTSHYSILNHILQNNNGNDDNIHFSFIIVFSLRLYPHYYSLEFRFITLS